MTEKYDGVADLIAVIDQRDAEIERQATEIKRLREALEPFANAADRAEGVMGRQTDITCVNVMLGRCRAARAALQTPVQGDG